MNRRFLLQHSAKFGPIFKVIAGNEFRVCILGLARGRSFLKEHRQHLAAMTLKLEDLFPKGFLRQMEGEDHRNYRKALVRAIQPADFTAYQAELATFARAELAVHATAHRDVAATAREYLGTLNRIASGMLVRVFFGASPGTASFDRILAAYGKMGPDGLVWEIGDRQREGFAEIREHLMAEYVRDPARRPPGAAESILGRLVDDGAVDETSLGNLIYMVEMGRYDTYSLFRWLSKYAGAHPSFAERVADEEPSDPTMAGSFTEAFVLETLRTDQSERMIRRVKQDIVFDGFLFPRDTTVRICLWEAHQSDEAFLDPSSFNPQRFLTGNPGPDDFSPFGLDHHQCPLGDVAIRSGAVFLQSLVRGYQVHPVEDGLPVRGTYHWEPASQFSVRLEPRLKTTDPSGVVNDRF